MPKRFEDFYAVKRNDNLGDPEFWNRRFQDLDLRLANREIDGERIAGAVDELQGLALQRLNDTFTPVIEEAIARLRAVGAQFTSTSDTTATLDTNQKVFLLAENTRDSFVVTDFVAIRPAGDITRGMVAQFVDYDRATGLLTVLPVQVVGTGQFSAWVIRVTGAPDLDHASRTDNPHQTTAAQVGAYTTGQVDALLAPLAPRISPNLSGTPTAPTAVTGTNTTQIATTAFVAAAVAALVDSAPSTLNTLRELANALGADPNFATTVTNALAKRVRVDAVQTFTASEIAQALANLQITDLLLPAGAILYFPGNLPNGWLRCNGALISRTAYARLWAYAQAQPQGPVSDATWLSGYFGCFSVGDGSTTFRLPDTRGEFIRVYDDGRGVDAGRAFGALQGDQIGYHGHQVNQTPHVHALDNNSIWYCEGQGAYFIGGGNFPINNPAGRATAGGYANISISAQGGNENRPRNIALVGAIKY